MASVVVSANSLLTSAHVSTYIPQNEALVYCLSFEPLVTILCPYVKETKSVLHKFMLNPLHQYLLYLTK